MRGSLLVNLSLVALCIVVSVTTGCGQPTPVSVATSEGNDAGTLRAQVNQADGAEATSVDVIGFSDAERRGFATLSPTERAPALSVYVVRNGAPQLPAVAGEYSAEGDSIRFTPRYPLPRGMRYQLAIDRNRLAGDGSTVKKVVSLEFVTAAAVATPATEIAQIYPTRSELPENQLKFYIHFSAPMSRGDAYRHIHLLDVDGQEMEAVFLELSEELWDPGLRRFTLLCDPGRVKRGLVPREELGSVLQEGKDYTLVIDADWRDAQGKPLTQEFRKSFHVIAPDQQPIDTADWKIEPPVPGSRESLVVTFSESLDHSLLLRMLRVQMIAGASVAGDVASGEAETSWQFTPTEPWPVGDYQLVIDTALEDLAGNSIGRAFDTDTSQPNNKPTSEQQVVIPFTVR